MKIKTSAYFSISLILVSLLALMLASEEAAASAKNGLYICANVIIPSLLPFLVLTSLLSGLGLSQIIAKWTQPMMQKLFGLSGQCSTALIFGLTGSYPVGAGQTVELYNLGYITKDEAQRLLPFCNNSGPAFIIGAVGVGVFSSSMAGLVLYVCHIAAAFAVGIIMCSGRRGRPQSTEMQNYQVRSFSAALSESVKSAVSSSLAICGFVVTFSVLTGLLNAAGILSGLAGALAVKTGGELSFFSSLLTGIFELGSGIGSMQGLLISPLNMALASFILGFGGLSVHCQTLAVIEGTGIKSAPHFAGRLLHGLISAVFAFVLSFLLI